MESGNSVVAQEAALFAWMQKLEINRMPETWEDLVDGVAFWEVLRDIDSDYFKADLPEPNVQSTDKWVPKWKNLKQVIKSVDRYVRVECDSPSSPLLDTKFDAKAIAMKEGHAREQILTITKLVLAAAINSTQREKYIQIMPYLDTSAQEAIKDIIVEMQPGTTEDVPKIGPPPVKVKPAQDPLQASPEPDSISSDSKIAVLQLEERMARLVAENKKIADWNKRLTVDTQDLQDRLEKSMSRNDDLEERLRDADDRLNHRNKAKSSEKDADIKIFENRISHQEDVIASLESKISDFEHEREALQRELNASKAASTQIQQLKDELDEVKIDRDNFARKANAADKYKQKLQGTQDMERENRRLRTENDELYHQNSELNRMREENKGHLLSIEQYRQLVSKIEQDHYNLKETQHRVQLTNREYEEELQRKKDEISRQQELITDLQERLDSGNIGRLSTGSAFNNLEAEIANSERTDADLRAEIAQLKAEIRRLKTSEGDVANVTHLTTLLEDERQKVAKLDSRFLEAQQAKVVLEAQLNAIREGTAPEGSEMFTDMLTEKLKTEQDLQKAKEELAQKSSELHEVHGQLSSAQTDLSAVSKEGLEQLEELKREDMKRSAALLQEISQLKQMTKDQRSDLDDQIRLFHKALLEKAELENRLSDQKDQVFETERSSFELQSSLDLMKNAVENRDQGALEALNQHMIKQTGKLESRREALARQTEHIKKLNATIKDLEDKLKRLEADEGEELAQNGAAEDKATQSALLEEAQALRRENALISTAWYDLTARIQTNSVVVARRANQEPRSWLAKQRRLLA